MNAFSLLSSAGLAAIAAFALQPSAGAASVSSSPGSNQLYLVISNSPSAVYLTAYNTISNVSYQIETNTDMTNPNGWGVWVTLLATNNVSPLSSLGLDFKEIYFRAVTLSSADVAPAPNTSPSLYLGRLDFNTNANQTPHPAELSSNNQSDRN